MYSSCTRIAFDIFLILGTLLTLSVGLGPQPCSADSPEVALFSSETRVLHSKIIGEDFDVFVSLPYSYARTESTYPVFFALDANIGFGIVDNTVHILSTLNKEIPEMIVVGVAYQIAGIEDWAARRRRDFWPTSHLEHDEDWKNLLSEATGRDDIVVTSGGAHEFLAFLREELIPYIEANYRISSSDRAIAGVSASGLFVLYALFEQPDLFQRYFAGSPSIRWDESYMYGLEERLAESRQDLPARLFMCVGGLESKAYLDNVDKMAALLRSRNYPSLRMDAVVFEHETHGSIFQSALSRGLRMLYAR